MTIFIKNIPAIACVVAAGYLAVHKLDGWGWFLFVGLLLSQA